MQRLDYLAAAEYATSHLFAIEEALARSSLGKGLLSLLKARASQINGCAFCLNMHTQEALRAGESVERLMLVAVHEESPLFDERERAALSYVECATRVYERGVPDAVYERLTHHFSPQQIVDLTVATGMINLWNRLSVTMRSDHPKLEHKLAALSRT